MEVSLDDITIPALNVISSAVVNEGDQILKVRNEKIRWVDQCTTLGSDGGTPVYVEDNGHQAVFFSRSNNLTDAHASEFRFTPGGTMNGLTAVTFDYRYLDYNTAIESGVSTAHIYTQFHVASYVNAYYDFINDDQWHSATVYTDASTSDGVTEFLINIFDFQGHIYISNLQFHGFNELGLEAAGGYDGINPISIDDLGIAEGATVPAHTSGHIFAQYDFNANKGIDLWFKPEYTVHGGDTWNYFYLFNKNDESGIVFRFNDNRAEDDGILSLYIYSVNAYGGATTVVQTAGAAGTFFYFPRSSGVKSSVDSVFHMAAYCINESTNLYRCLFTAGVEDGTQYFPSTNPEDKTNTPLYFDIELGANYFETGVQMIRFSSSTGDLKLHNSASQEQLVVYKDYDGSVVGKKEAASISTFDYRLANKQFVGWFDQNGEKVTNGQAITSKTIVQPLFVDQQADMIVPSSIMMGNKGEWYNVNSSTVTGETASGIGYLASSNRVDMYFIYQSTAFTGADNWAKFGFPYDFLDARSRLTIRINENNNGRLDGYVFGGSLGGEGADGTYFNLGYTFRKTGDLILVHMSVIDNGSNNVSFTLECTNIRTRETNAKTYSVTFSQYSASEGAARNKMCLLPAVGCEWRFVDAF